MLNILPEQGLGAGVREDGPLHLPHGVLGPSHVNTCVSAAGDVCQLESEIQPKISSCMGDHGSGYCLSACFTIRPSTPVLISVVKNPLTWDRKARKFFLRILATCKPFPCRLVITREDQNLNFQNGNFIPYQLKACLIMDNTGINIISYLSLPLYSQTFQVLFKDQRSRKKVH